jgi:pimeloyl-ACP methyl ester carboxylesterase
MTTFTTFDGITLSYEDEGDGFPVVLLHGFAADTNLNYVRSGILDRLLDEGYRVIALDARGHGLSEKPHEPAAYAGDAAVKDVQALLDEVGVERCALVGYSMGGGTALRVAAIEPRVAACAVVGVGAAGIGAGDADGAREGRPGAGDGDGAEEGSSMIEAFTTDDPGSLSGHAKRFRTMADAIRADRVALAAVLSAGGPSAPVAVDQITQPVLVLAGTEDVLAGSVERIAGAIPGATAATVPGDHFSSPSQPELHDELVAFLATVPPS